MMSVRLLDEQIGDYPRPNVRVVAAVQLVAVPLSAAPSQVCVTELLTQRDATV